MFSLTPVPDPPGTINPLKLSAWAVPLPDSGASDTIELPAPPETTLIASVAVSHGTEAEAATRPPPLPEPAVPRLTRISSDCDLENEKPLKPGDEYENVRKEFEQSFTDRPAGPSSRLARHTSHHGYFRRQIQGQTNVLIPSDPDVILDESVVVDKATASIYDAYLLRVDIAKNVNVFHRQQVLFHPDFETYTIVTREGRVGLPGTARQKVAFNLELATTMFRTVFFKKTGLAWSRRYERPSRLAERFCFVELDYRHRIEALLVEGSDRNYEAVDTSIHESLRDLMEIMLYGSSGRQDAWRKETGTVATRSAFTAPYEYLSPWACFQGFKALQRIYGYLESESPVRWKALVSASSRYRSLIPFSAGHGHTPVVSSYHALFLELKFIHRLWPRAEVATMLTEVHLRGSLQLSKYGALSQPLYRAYSSLRHGFRRLTDPLTTEFFELKQYLEKSCHGIHGLRVELQDIYSVFIKSNLPNPYRDWIETKFGFDASGEERLLLWHGTPLDSLLGILDLGLQVRRQGFTWTGTMFGNGIYFADASSKSATFCKHQAWNGDAVLLLCEVDVGLMRLRQLKALQDGHSVVRASSGWFRCIEGPGRLGPGRWKDVSWEMAGAPSSYGVRMPDTSIPYTNTYSGGTLGFNEYVIYDPSHVLIRYIFRIKIRR